MAEQDTLIYIEDNDTLDASISAKNFAKVDVQNRAYFNTLGAKLIKKYLVSESIDIADTYNIHSIQKVLEEVDISDIMLKNIHIDVRVVFNENYIFVPKSHFSYNILPDIYVVLLMSNDEKYMSFLGFFEPKMINKNNENEEYYFIEKEKLTSPIQLKDYIKNFDGNTNEAISATELEASDLLILSLVDQDITDAERKQLLQNLVKSAELRDRFIEFENFELLAYKAEHSPDVRKAEDTLGQVSNNNKYDEAATATAAALQELDALGMAASITALQNNENIAEEPPVINVTKMDAIEGLTEVIDSDDDDIIRSFESSNSDIEDLSALENTENISDTEIKISDDIDLDFPSFEELSFEDDILASSEDKIQKSNENSLVKAEATQSIKNPADIAMNFSEIEITPITNKENLEPIQNPETVSFADFEINSEKIKNSFKDYQSENTIDFDNIETSNSETKTFAKEKESENTIDFDNIETSNSETKTFAKEKESENTIDFDNIELIEDTSDKTTAEEDLDLAFKFDDIDLDASETVLNETNKEDVDLSNFDEISPKEEIETPQNDISEVQLDDNIDKDIQAEFGELSLEDELANLNLDEPLSLDDTEMELDEDLTQEIKTQNLEETKNSKEVLNTENIEPLTVSKTSNESENTIDFDKIETSKSEAKTFAEENENENTIDENALYSTSNEANISEKAIETVESDSIDTNLEEIKLESIDENTETDNISQETDSELNALLSSEAFQTAVTEKTTSDANSITDLDLNADELQKSTNTEGAILEDIDTDDSQDLISQIDDLLNSEETNIEDNKTSDDDNKLEMLFNTNTENLEENSDLPVEEYAEENMISANVLNIPEKGKKAIMITATALATIFLSVAGIGFYLKGKNSEIVSNNPIENDTPNLPTPSSPLEMPSESDINNILNSPAPSQTPQTPQSKQKQTQKQNSAPAKKITAPSSNIGQTKSKTPLKEISIRSLTWEVPDYLSYSDKVKKYLQTAGRSIKLSLSSDLLLAKEYAYSNQIKVELKLNNNGSVIDAQIVKSSGSNEINEIVLRTVKETLRVVKPAPDEIPTANFKLGLIINL